MVPVAAADALVAAGNGRPVTADELLAHHGQASSGNMEKVQKHRTLATEVAELVSRLQLVRSIVAIHLAVWPAVLPRSICRLCVCLCLWLTQAVRLHNAADSDHL
jgi:hypothetical protein